MPTPKTVKVIVYCGKNLKAKKGDVPPMAWTVFGFGKSKCCTAQIRDKNPTWNEENEFTISDPKLPLKLIVKDKDEPLGQIQLNLVDIPSDEHMLKWVPLGQHRRNLNPIGQICFDCWITEYHDEGSSSKKFNYFKFKFKKNIDKNEINANQRRDSVQTGGTSLKGSVSCEDLSSRRKSYPHIKPLETSKTKDLFGLRRSSSVSIQTPPKKIIDLVTVRENGGLPDIKFISPISGPSAGGTLVQMTGVNFGNCRDDIIQLVVAGVDCLPMLEYYSPNKIMCTTPGGDGTGPIRLVTKSGGAGTSKISFEFIKEDSNEKMNGIAGGAHGAHGILERKSSSSLKKNLEKKPKKYDKTPESKNTKDAMTHEIEDLHEHIAGLETENSELRKYVDRLLLYLMEKYPEALESKRLYR